MSADGSRLAAAGISHGENCVKIWTPPSAKPERTLILGVVTGLLEHESPVGPGGRQEVAFSPDGKLVAGTCVILHPRRRQGVVKVWEAGAGRDVFSSENSGIGGRAVAFSPDGAYLIAGGYNLAALIWDIPAGRLRLTLPAYNPDSSYPRVAAGAPGSGPDGPGPPVSQLLFTPGGKVLTRSDGKARSQSPWPPLGLRRPAARNATLPQFEKTAVDDEVVFSPAGQWGVSMDVSADAVRLFHLSGMNQARPPAGPKPSTPYRSDPAIVKIEQGSIQSMALSNMALALGEKNGQVTLVKVDPGNGTVLERIPLHGHHGETSCLAFSGNGKHVVAAGNRALTLWDFSLRPETRA